MSTLSVTQVLKLSGLVDTSWYTDEGRERGKAVHAATEYVDEGDLDETWLASTDDKTRGRVEAYERFIKEVSPEILKTEFEVSHPLGFVGHPDRLVAIDGRYYVIDIKPPGEAVWHPIQLAAYQRAIMHTYAKYQMVGRCNLYLGDGKYKLVNRMKARDWGVFQAALIVAQFKEAR